MAAACGGAALAAAPSIEVFASRPDVEHAAISPDGRYLATVLTRAGRGAVVVREESFLATNVPAADATAVTADAH